MLDKDMLTVELLNCDEKGLDWQTCKYMFKVITQYYNYFESAKNGDKTALQYLAHASEGEAMKYVGLLTGHFFAHTLESGKNFGIYKNCPLSEGFYETIADKLKIVTLDEERKAILRKNFIACLNIAVNSHVDPVYKKYNFYTHWEDVNMNNIHSEDLIEAIMMEMCIRSTFRLTDSCKTTTNGQEM